MTIIMMLQSIWHNIFIFMSSFSNCSYPLILLKMALVNLYLTFTVYSIYNIYIYIYIYKHACDKWYKNKTIDINADELMLC